MTWASVRLCAIGAVAAMGPGTARDLAIYFSTIAPKERLRQRGQDYHSGAASPMPLVANTLGPAEIEALVSYRSFVQ